MRKPPEKSKPRTVGKEKAKQWQKPGTGSSSSKPTTPSAGPAKGTGPVRHNPPKR
jgi:hypothetical protein